MKVRHKVVRDLHWSVVDEGRDYFIVSTDVATWALPKSQYEPIPTDRWQDVTGRLVEGTMTAGQCWVHYPYLGPSGGSGMSETVIAPLPEGYRLRKVQLRQPRPQPQNWFSVPEPYDLVWAFIIECKVE